MFCRRLGLLICSAVQDLTQWWSAAEHECESHVWHVQNLLFRLAADSPWEMLITTLQDQRAKALKGHLQSKAEGWKALVAEMIRGSGKAAFRFIKGHETIEDRPFMHVPLDGKAEARRTFWAEKWHENCITEWTSHDLILDLARKQASSLKLITSAQIVETLKRVPCKKGGPDGISFQFLKALPREAMSGLAFIFQEVERTLQWPGQFLVVHVCCLAKNKEVERPICLSHTLYRLWCRLRKHLVDTWLLR